MEFFVYGLLSLALWFSLTIFTEARGWNIISYTNGEQGIVWYIYWSVKGVGGSLYYWSMSEK